MKDEQKIILKISQLEKALEKFNEILNINSDKDYIIDASIQRFEFCYELIWKTLKLALQLNSIETNSPKDVLRKAYQYKYIENIDLWINLIEVRNLTTHTYDQILANEVYALLPQYAKIFTKVLYELKREFLNDKI